MKKDLVYQKALEFTKNHYENFPVISFLIPGKLQKDVAIIYWFARTADDIADEGNLSNSERLDGLDNFEKRLTELSNGNYSNDFEFALGNTIKERKLSIENFYKLISAFKQDVTKNRYNTFEEIENYCSRSANPVGRLILELFNIREREAFNLSDKICTALQLTNFYQDVTIDVKKDRIYFPLEELDKFKIDENQFLKSQNNSNLQALVKHNVDRAKNLFTDGRGLLKHLKGRLKLEIKWTILGGVKILDNIEKNSYNVFAERSKLSRIDFMILLLNSFIK